MNTPQDAEPSREALLNVFCTPEAGAYRVYLWPGWAPRRLQVCFDARGMAFPAHLDFEELKRQMARHGYSYECKHSLQGDAELLARGPAAGTLASWLANAFASGMRTAP